MAAFLIAQGVAAQYITDGLVGWWPMEDYVGTTTVERVQGSSCAMLYAPKITNGLTPALDTSRSNRILQLTASRQDLLPSNAVSVAAWVFVRVPTSQFIIVDAQGLSPYPGFVLQVFTQRLYANVAYNANSIEMVAPQNFSGSQWVHVAMTYNRTNLSLYENGVMVTNRAVANMITYAATQNVAIGSSDVDANIGNGDASIDDVRIYNRALVSNEVYALWSRLGGIQ